MSTAKAIHPPARPGIHFLARARTHADPGSQCLANSRPTNERLRLPTPLTPSSVVRRPPSVAQFDRAVRRRGAYEVRREGRKGRNGDGLTGRRSERSERRSEVGIPRDPSIRASPPALLPPSLPSPRDTQLRGPQTKRLLVKVHARRGGGEEGRRRRRRGKSRGRRERRPLWLRWQKGGRVELRGKIRGIPRSLFVRSFHFQSSPSALDRTDPTRFDMTARGSASGLSVCPSVSPSVRPSVCEVCNMQRGSRNSDGARGVPTC